MSIKKSQYFHEGLLRKYVLQFMAIFSGLQVRIGTSEPISTTSVTGACGTVTNSPETDENYPKNLISVPIHYGFKDRIVAAILADNVQNKPLRLPLMSANLRTVRQAPERNTGLNTTRREVYTPAGGIIPDDTVVIHQPRGVPYKLGFELLIYTSNMNQFLQILEQILIIFDPSIQFQTSDALFDWRKISSAELVGIDLDFNFPSGTDRRIIVGSLAFDVIAYLSAPDAIKRDFIKDIYLRFGVVSNLEKSNEDLLAELDAEGVPYELIVSADQLPFE